MTNSSVRGTGVRQTIPHLGRVSGLWLFVASAAVIVASTSSFLLFGGRIEEAHQGSLLFTLVIQTVLLLAGLLALAVFTTHRVMGPWIAVRRLCQAVRSGDRSARLRFRADDPRLKPVEEEMNAMLDELLSPSADDAGG